MNLYALLGYDTSDLTAQISARTRGMLVRRSLIQSFHNGSQSFPNLFDPIVPADGDKGLGDGFVNGFGCHVDRVRGLVQIGDNDDAGFKRHDGNLLYSLFVRQCGACGEAESESST